MPVRVLIVDDQPIFCEAAGEMLRRRGYAVVGVVHDRAAAIAAVERLAPDAILLDVRLGDDDGFAVAGELRRVRPAAVLLVSSEDYRQCSERVRLAGARGFVLKSSLIATDLTQFWRPTDG